MAGVQFDAHYHVTSVDPPELIHFIRSQYPDVQFDYPRDKDGKQITMWSLIDEKGMLPSRRIRFCCEKLKETGGKGRVVVTGVRWEESYRRKKNQGLVTMKTKSKKLHKNAENEVPASRVSDSGEFIIMNEDNDSARRMVEMCYRTRKTLVNPIIDWTEEDVWEFLNDVVKAPHCSLYDEGFKRIGCIGCPLSGGKNMRKEFERWPKYENLYKLSIGRMIDRYPDRAWKEAQKYSPEYEAAQETLNRGDKIQSIFDWFIK